MKFVDLFVIEIEAMKNRKKFHAIGHFDRIPMVEELVEAYTVQMFRNDDVVPGFTEAITGIAMRGVPTPPANFPPQTSAILSYGDGSILVTRTERIEIDESFDEGFDEGR